MGVENLQNKMTSNSFNRKDIEKINQRFKDEVPKGSSWVPKNIVPGLPNIKILKVLSYELEGYKVKAFYDNGSVKETIIPYERFGEWYVSKN